MKTSTVLLTAVFFTGVAMAADQYKLDAANTTVKFVGSKKDGKHEGTFKKLEGTLNVDEKNVPKSNLAVTIDIDSITTDAEKLSTLRATDRSGGRSGTGTCTAAAAAVRLTAGRPRHAASSVR